MNFLAAYRERLAAAGLLLLSLLVLWEAIEGPPWTSATLVQRLTWRMAAQGTSSALAILAAAWVVWGPGRLTTRAALSALLVVVVSLSWFYVSTRGSRWLGPRAEFQLLTLGTWLGALGLCAAAWKFGIRIVDRSGGSLAGDPRSRQMSLLGLLALMSGVAVLLGTLRQLLPQDVITWRPTVDDVIRLIAQIGASLLVASTILTCFHVPRPGWINLVLSLGLIAIIAALHIAAYGQLSRMYFWPLDVRMQVRVVHYFTETAWLLAAVGMLRCFGWRLRRIVPAAIGMPRDLTPTAAAAD